MRVLKYRRDAVAMQVSQEMKGGRLELVDHSKKSLNKGDHGKKSDESSFVVHVCVWLV